jgi:phosphatidylserine decarboxylase
MHWPIFLFSLAEGILVYFALTVKFRVGNRSGFLISAQVFLWVFVADWLFGRLSEGFSGMIGFGFATLVIFSCMGFYGLVRFHRDPERIPPRNGSWILSPADGIVLDVRRIRKNDSPPRGLKTKPDAFLEMEPDRFRLLPAYLIGIEMNILDVHVNRAPISGRIVHQEHHPGQFLSLRNPEARLRNERTFTLFRNRRLSVGMLQIASRTVRRIVSYLNEGDTVKAGQRVGMIQFGSQVDLIIPCRKNIRVLVRAGDRIKAGTGIIAEIG